MRGFSGFGDVLAVGRHPRCFGFRHRSGLRRGTRGGQNAAGVFRPVGSRRDRLCLGRSFCGSGLGRGRFGSGRRLCRRRLRPACRRFSFRRGRQPSSLPRSIARRRQQAWQAPVWRRPACSRQAPLLQARQPIPQTAHHLTPTPRASPRRSSNPHFAPQPRFRPRTISYFPPCLITFRPDSVTKTASQSLKTQSRNPTHGTCQRTCVPGCDKHYELLRRSKGKR